MAQRRMLSLKIIDTDIFMDMPLSAQTLYFHLVMRADDDGFVGNKKKIIRMVGCNDDDLRILESKQYVIPFASGVAVITHWKIHNLIRSDRYTATIYTDEKDLLMSYQGSYQLSYQTATTGVTDGSTTGIPQVRLGKNRLGKDSKNPPNPQRGKVSLDYDFIEEEEWRELYRYWSQNKKSPYRKQAGLEAGFRKLHTLSGSNLEKAVKIVDQSLANNWVGIFELKEIGGEDLELKRRRILDAV